MKTMTHQIKICEVPTQLVATIRERVPMDDIGTEMGEAFGEIARAGVSMAGLPFAIFHEMGADEADVEIGYPVERDVGVGRVRSSVLDGGRMACVVHAGPYWGIGGAYRALTEWIEEHGEQVVGPPREVYLNEPAEGVVPLTEVQMPLRVSA
jgi:effector-binding domain-containing protein